MYFSKTMSDECWQFHYNSDMV